MAILLSTFIASGGGSEGGDLREFKNWQDFCGQISGHTNYMIGQATRVVDGSSVNRQVSNGTFTVPSGVSKVRISMVGGGGGGGVYATTYYGAAGGGGACFASGEYNVTAGQTLAVTSGDGGRGRGDQGYGGNGGTSSVTDSTTGGTLIAVSAAGGSGGQYTSTVGTAGTSHSVGGSSLVSGTVVGGHGGPGGAGSSQSFGYGPEGYSAGGGGSAGSFLGAGHAGGAGTNGGYTYSSGGGGGIGGAGGVGYGSDSTSVTSTYQDHAGGGGGSAGPGQNGAINNASYRTEGGPGRLAMPSVSDYDSGTNNVYGKAPENWALKDTLMKGINAARYGDGEDTGPRMHELSSGGYRGANPDSTILDRGTRLAGGSVSQFDQLPQNGGSVGSGTGNGPKSFNGVFGRLWGGGGGGAPCHDSNFGYYNHSGGDGGSGGGGGGAAGSTTSYNSGTMTIYSYSDWDWSNLAVRSHDNAWDVNGYRINGNGGHGGALGGGGGGVYYGMAGAGGIGGGGGGAGGHYSGAANVQWSGPGGPGYVLIEW